MVVTIYLDGGAGRVLTAIPALEKYVIQHPDDQIVILVNYWADLLFGHPLLHNLVRYSESLESNNIISNTDHLIVLEPYHNINYVKGKLSLAQTFDLLLNGTYDSAEKYRPVIFSTKQEEIIAMDVIKAAKDHSNNQKTIVIQPFGSSARSTDHKAIIDPSSRSLELLTYYHLIDKLKDEYALIYMGEHPLEEKITAKPQASYRDWYSIINAADYFIGVDSLGQHYAHACNKPGTVIVGGTNPVNVSYPHHFNIFGRPGIEITYSPIRLTGIGQRMADFVNDKNMLYTQEDMDQMINNIYNHLKMCNLKGNEVDDSKCKPDCSCN